MKLAIVTPHFAPDVAPTGVVVTRIAEELVERGHRLEVITSLPWYRHHKVEAGWGGRVVRHEDLPWGRITRVDPFATDDKRALVRRAAAFGAFSVVGAGLGARGDRVDGVLAVSPPLTLGLTGWAIAKRRGGPLIFNIQDVYPDVAVELGALSNRVLIKGAHALESLCYRLADAVTVLSDDLRSNIEDRTDPSKIHVIPNFVDTQRIQPGPRDNAYREEFGLVGKTVVMYAGNVGLSQSLDLLIEAAVALSYDTDIVFVINGQGAARAELERKARGLPNVRFVEMQPAERLGEVLNAADVHVVPLKQGLARASVPSKTYSILAAGRPIVASVDPGSEISRMVQSAKAGLTVSPEDPEAFTKAIRRLIDSPEEAARMGEAGRSWVEGWASPAAIAEAYEELFASLSSPSRL